MLKDSGASLNGTPLQGNNNNIKQNTNNNDNSQYDGNYNSTGYNSLINGIPSSTSNNTGQNPNNNGNSKYDGSYSATVRKYLPGQIYYPMWPYNKNDLNYYYENNGYYDDNNLDGNNNIDHNSPNVNSNNNILLHIKTSLLLTLLYLCLHIYILKKSCFPYS